MKITFDDGSFIELAQVKEGQIRLVLGAIKSYNQSTMSAVDLDEDQVAEIIHFLSTLGSEIST